MAATPKDIISQFLFNMRKDIVEDMRSKQISNGDLNMQVVANDNEGRLQGNSYWYYLWKGRRPGKQPPILSIKEWVIKKGIQATIKIDSLAFLIARKIGKLGTDIYLGRRPGLMLEQIIEVNKEEFEQSVGEYIKALIEKEIRPTLKLISL